MRIAPEWSQKQSDPAFHGSICFDKNESVSKIMKAIEPRFLPNPEENWGPKSAAKVYTECGDLRKPKSKKEKPTKKKKNLKKKDKALSESCLPNNPSTHSSVSIPCLPSGKEPGFTPKKPELLLFAKKESKKQPKDEVAF